MLSSSWRPIETRGAETHLFSFILPFCSHVIKDRAPEPSEFCLFSFPHPGAQGLLSVAFSPGFHNTGVFYVSYVVSTVSNFEHTRVSSQASLSAFGSVERTHSLLVGRAFIVVFAVVLCVDIVGGITHTQDEGPKKNVVCP